MQANKLVLVGLVGGLLAVVLGRKASGYARTTSSGWESLGAKLEDSQRRYRLDEAKASYRSATGSKRISSALRVARAYAPASGTNLLLRLRGNAPK